MCCVFLLMSAEEDQVPKYKVMEITNDSSKKWKILVLVLLITNIYVITQNYYQDNWASEIFQERIDYIDNFLDSSIHNLEEVLDDQILEVDELQDVLFSVQITARKIAETTYHDQNHHDMWNKASDQFESLETLIEGIIFTLKNNEQYNETILLDEKESEYFIDIHENLILLRHALLLDVETEGENPWDKARYEQEEEVSKQLHSLRESITNCWNLVYSLNNESFSTPYDQAKQIIIEKLGKDYYENYFSYVGTNSNLKAYAKSNDWCYQVRYNYFIQIGEYNATREVNVYYNILNNFVSYNSMPQFDTLMPFNVTREEAIDLAKLTDPDNNTDDFDAEIYFWKKSSDKGLINRYVWSVSFYRTPRTLSSGSFWHVLLDPHSGEILDSIMRSWASAAEAAAIAESAQDEAV